MTQAPIAVVGGRGKTGRAVIAALARNGVSARPIGRAELASGGEAFEGASALHIIAPNMHPDEAGFVTELLGLARKAGIRRVVHHSVATPYEPDMPHHLAKAESERLVRHSGLAWTILQPCAYVQNFLPALRSSDPVLEVAYDPNAMFGLVDLLDVGEASARALTEDAFVGATVELGGPHLVSVNEVAATASEVLGREVLVRHISPGEWAVGPGAGLDPREREWLMAMFRYYDAHGLPTGAYGTRAVLGRDPNSLFATLERELSGHPKR